MRKRCHALLALIAFGATVWLGTNIGLAQDSFAKFENFLRDKASFEETDFGGLEEGQGVVRLLPAADKREVAVCGLVKLQIPAEVFLEAYRESMTQKVNPAILEIGRFSEVPTTADLRTLTFEDRDLEDLKECVVGDCKLKLSAEMIERLHREIDWGASDYRMQATQLLKQMLLDYVTDYVARGEAALIKYHDKSKELSLVEDQLTLRAESTYVNNLLPGFRLDQSSAQNLGLTMVESAIVWSKIKFGLKPVIAINHIMVYRRNQETGPQVLITSNQIYASHYFDSSLAVTAFVTYPSARVGSYLIYENRSRTDGLGGMFGKFKRDIVEDRAVANLENILETSKTKLNAQVAQEDSTSTAHKEHGWRAWNVRRIHIFLCLLMVTFLVTLFGVRSYGWKNSFTGGTPH